MKFEQVCQSLYAFFSQNRIIRAILPYAAPLMFLLEGIHFVGMFIWLGSAVNIISYLGFFFMILLILTLCEFKIAAVGLSIYAAQYLYNILSNILTSRRMEWGSVIYLIIYIFFAYQSYKKSLQINE